MAQAEAIYSLYEHVLSQRLGFATERDDGAISASVGMLQLIFPVHDDDPEYLQMLTIVPSEQISLDRATMTAICLDATRDVKVAKATLDEDGDLIFAIEMIVASPDALPTEDHLAAVLPRAITLLTGIIRRVFQDMEFHSLTAGLDDGN